jgi:hypothetical protein
MDQVVDSAANATVMSPLDCFSGYHQCWMAKEDEEKTTFITPFGTFGGFEKCRPNLHQNDWGGIQAAD